MQVLQVITSLYTGGAEKLLVDSIPIYREKGIDMELLLLNGDETPFFQTLKKSGIKIHYLTKGNIRKIYNPLLVFRIIPFLKKYDIVHVHLFPTLYWAALAKRLSFGKTKLVFTEHNTHNRRIGNITGRVLDKFIYHQYDTIVSITKEVDTIIKLHLSFKKDKFKIIHNGINLSQFVRDFPKDENTVHSKIILIQVSAFREQKDQVTLIRALHYLPQNVNLLLVGDGDKRTKCEDLVKELNLSGRVSFLGVR
ncbi:MAG: glycosyltransferase, partial [Bacteroidales bacterium]|nr:glycosyltransferase [Bacteroidales bacterium]